MPNTNITTDWFYKEINLPLVNNGINNVVLLTEYTEEIEVTSRTGVLTDLATVEFLKFYFPELWFPYIDPDAFSQVASNLPSELISASISNAATIFSIIRSALHVKEYRKGTRPGSTYKVYVAMSGIMALADRSIENPIFQNPSWIRRDELAQFLDPNFSESLPLAKICPDDTLTLRERHLGEKTSTLEFTSFPYFPNFSYALDYWNESRQVVLGTPGNTPSALILNWSAVDSELQTINQLMAMYDTQIKEFDGQITPGMNLEQESLRLSETISSLGNLLSLNGIEDPTPEDDIQIIFNDRYQIISMLMSKTGIHRQVVIGYLSTLDSEPFTNSQTMVYLNRWGDILSISRGLNSESPSRKFQFFINRIANSVIRTYHILYCGPSHTAPAGEVLETLASYGLAQAVDIPEEGMSAVLGDGTIAKIPAGTKTLHLTFPQLRARTAVLHDPTNQEFILSTELERTEKDVEDAVKKVMNKMREFQNSEGMQIFKEVLNKTGLDMLIKEALRCLIFNSTFQFNDIRSDIKDFISNAENFFEKPRKPKVPKMPTLEIDLSFFSIDGNLHLVIRKMLIDVLLGIVKGLVMGIVELIREACAEKDLAGARRLWAIKYSQHV